MKVLVTLLISLFSFHLTASPTIVMETSEGTIEIELMPEAAPIACENMIQLAKEGYYNGVIFHRIVQGMCIQGGDPKGTGQGGTSFWGEPFEDEFTPKLIFDRPGLLAMANCGPDTNGSQFFITTNPAPWLNHKHTIFGEVTKGYAVVKKIEGSGKWCWGLLETSYPLKTVTINQISIKD